MIVVHWSYKARQIADGITESEALWDTDTGSWFDRRECPSTHASDTSTDISYWIKHQTGVVICKLLRMSYDVIWELGRSRFLRFPVYKAHSCLFSQKLEYCREIIHRLLGCYFNNNEKRITFYKSDMFININTHVKNALWTNTMFPMEMLFWFMRFV